MKTYISLALLLFTGAVITVTSCDMPHCKNTNPVFDKYPIASKEYKAELVRQLNRQAPGKIRFWIDNYLEENGRIYMGMFVQGDGLCAKGILDITDSTAGGFRIKHYKDVKGGGFSGAQLDGLNYRIDSSTGNYNFVLTDVAHIID